MADKDVHIKNERENVIYGAGVFGRRLWEFFKELPVPVHFFCQTKKGDAPMEIDGIPVISLEELRAHSADKNIFISLHDKKTSSILRQMLQEIFQDTARIYECGDFIDCNLRSARGEYYCPLCGNHFDKFLTGGGAVATPKYTQNITSLEAESGKIMRVHVVA